MLENATLLTNDWLSNYLSYPMEGSPQFQLSKFRDYYIITCGFIRDNHFLRLTPSQIEEYIANGEYTYTDTIVGVEVTITCEITDADERADYFRLAQAKQLIYDFNGGRAAMIRGEDVHYGVCKDAVNVLKLLGLYQRTQTII